MVVEANPVVRPIPLSAIIDLRTFVRFFDIARLNFFLLKAYSNSLEIMNKLMPKIPPRGSVCVEILSLFPTLKNISKQEIISVEVLGSNIQGPFTFVSIPNGDFNIHHFC